MSILVSCFFEVSGKKIVGMEESKWATSKNCELRILWSHSSIVERFCEGWTFLLQYFRRWNYMFWLHLAGIKKCWVFRFASNCVCVWFIWIMISTFQFKVLQSTTFRNCSIRANSKSRVVNGPTSSGPNPKLRVIKLLVQTKLRISPNPARTRKLI